MPTPESLARQHIYQKLTAAGWIVQDFMTLNLGAGQGVAVREFPTASGEADYVLFVDRKADGAVEAKPEGTTLRGVFDQTAKYLTSFPGDISHVELRLSVADTIEEELDGALVRAERLRGSACPANAVVRDVEVRVRGEVGLNKVEWLAKVCKKPTALIRVIP